MSSEVKYGELTSWDEGDAGGNDFLNLKEGDNEVRIFTNPFQFYVAWVKDASGANHKVRGAVKNCPLVKRGVDVKARWYLGVLDRKSGQPKIVEIPPQVYRGIKEYHKNSKWGDVRGYDLNIKRNPKGQQPLYTVIAYPHSPLTDEEKDLVNRFLGRVDISKLTQPPTPQEVEERLQTIGLFDANPRSTKQGATVVSPPKDAQPTIGDDEFDFGDEDGDM